MDKHWKFRTGTIYKQRVRKLEWLWEPLILKNCVSVIISDGGIGKSGFSLWLADQLCGQNKRVTYLEIEGFGGGIVERLENWDLKNQEKIIFPVYEVSENLDVSICVEECNQIEDIIKHAPSDLLIIDSLTSLASGKNLNDTSVASGIFKKLGIMADTYKTAILVLAHTNKNHDNEPLSMLSMRGSGTMTQLARTVMTIENSLGSIDVTQKKLIQHKTNIVGGISTVTFKLDQFGLYNYSLDAEIKREEGTAAAKYRTEALRLLSNNKNKEETKAKLKEIGASSEESRRAIRYAATKLNIVWEG